MKHLRLTVGLVALSVITMAESPADAAWNNVFQVTCWSCRPKTATSNYYVAPTPVYSSPAYSYSYSSPAAGCCEPAPQQCTTKYVQRCYYQPVTSYQTQSYYEPVTSYQTKTYYEPVTTYRYSCYYDSCSCSYQQVATPCTSYQARQQTCAVQSWVQRCAQVPVTSYQKSYYYEPQTSCCQQQAPSCCTPTSGGGQQAPVVDGSQQLPMQQQQTQQPPLVEGKSQGGSQLFDYYQPKQQPKEEQMQRQLPPSGQLQSPSKSNPVVPPPSVKLERIAKGDGTVVDGQIVSDSNAPKGGVKLTFVSAKRQAPEKTVTANAAGRFEVELPAGSWLVYVRTADGQQVYHSRMEIESKQQRAPIVLVSR